MASWIWVLIPLAGILLAGFIEWLTFKRKQDKLGMSTSELEAELQALRKTIREREEREKALERRLQNLETIVTSEPWDALVAGKETDGLASDARLERRSDAEATIDLAERLARRLGG